MAVRWSPDAPASQREFLKQPSFLALLHLPTSAPNRKVLEKHDHQPDNVEPRLRVAHAINAKPKPQTHSKEPDVRPTSPVL